MNPPYTTYSETIKAEIGYSYRGFWRVKLWYSEKALIEFGFPGLRIKKFTSEEFSTIKEMSKTFGNDETVFYPSNYKQLKLIQQLIDIGFLVAD